MGDSDCNFSLSSLLCEEDGASLNVQEEDNTYIELNPYLVSGDDDDKYIETLFEKETANFGSINHESSDDSWTLTQSRLKGARLDAIEWIFNTRAIFGFHFHTAYLSVAYFDQFLSKRSIDDGKLWAIRLLSVACLSIAAKIEERKVPPLSEFPVENYEFENKVIKRMELLVLTTLEWKMGSVTPFTYLPYLVKTLCDESKRKELTLRAVELILSIIKEIISVDHPPSIIAAAAVLAASDSQLSQKTLELKMSVISVGKRLNNDRVFSCYSLMQQIGMGTSKTPKFMISPHASSVRSSPKLPVSSASGAKRRLSFDDIDKGCPLRKFSRK